MNKIHTVGEEETIHPTALCQPKGQVNQLRDFPWLRTYGQPTGGLINVWGIEFSSYLSLFELLIQSIKLK